MPLGQGLATDTTQAIAAPDFDALMARLVPFEARPHVAVAVSGGGDSMALTLMAHDWAMARGGRITALTVDHGLRPEAAAEAAQVAAWCEARGIAHVTLTRSGAAPASGLQAFARAARYELLETWCRDHTVLHLLLAHQSEDQAETAAMRAASGSGADGLAGMAGIVERGAVRLLRPLLGVTRAALRDYLRGRGQGWIEDPSNRNPAFTRVRVRAELARTPPGARHDARALGVARAAREAATADWLARFVTLDPAGFAALDRQAFAGPDARGAERLGPKALGAVLATVSGSEYPPRTEQVARLYRALAAGLPRDTTLGGCRILKLRGRIFICRELAAVEGPQPLVPGREIRWDGRFLVALGTAAPGGLSLGALGGDACVVARDTKERGKSAALRLPAAVRATLPALRDAKGVVAVPSLGYFKCCREEAETVACRVEFRPIRSLTGAGFRIV